MIRVYIDDLFIVGESQKEINLLKTALTTCFTMTNLGPVTHYLDLWITKNLILGTIFLTQETHI